MSLKLKIQEQHDNLTTVTINKGDMCDYIFEIRNKTLVQKLEALENNIIAQTSCTDSSIKQVRAVVAVFKKQFTTKWASHCRHKSRFLELEKGWLESDLVFDITSKISVGRRPLEFNECSERSKRRKTSELRSSHSAAELSYAAQMKMRESGNTLQAHLMKKICESAEFAHKCSEGATAMKTSKLSSVEALSLIMEAQLSRKQYNTIRKYSEAVYPSYKEVQREKNLCYPSESRITETEAEVPLQSLLDHTTNRLLMVQKDVLPHSSGSLVLYSKWGFDGSSSHNQYMQKFVSDDADDKYMFLSSLVPLRLVSEENERKVIIWQNPWPSSTRFCRPIKLLYRKETEELVKREKENMDYQISKLKPTKCTFSSKDYTVKQKPIFTMVDGKICNYLSDTKSALKCYLCDSTSKDFNNIDEMLLRPIKKDFVSFGLSTLHAWIRFFESLLHIAYKLPIQSWRINKQNEKTVTNTKKRIQKDFLENMSLIVDRPKPGFGNSNDGNVARKFFQHYEQSAAITGIDKDLIRRFYLIFQTLSSGFNINTNKFRDFCLETANLYVRLYPWYPMPTSVHKILIHGSEIIHHALLPIGQLSEEAQESRNKDFKNFREKYSRKGNRRDNMEDIFNRLLISSDPKIIYTRPLPVVLARKSLYPEVLEMLEVESMDTDTDSDNSAAVDVL